MRGIFLFFFCFHLFDKAIESIKIHTIYLLFFLLAANQKVHIINNL